MLIPLGIALGWVLYRRHTSIHNAVPTTVAAVVTLVPEGLILLTSVTYAVAAVRMARRGALAQQLNAIESLASVDTICLDKTGTLTDARLQVEKLVPAAGVDEGELAHELGRYAASAPSRNATLEAIDERCGGAAEEPRSSVPFSSRRRWSALAARRDDVRARRAGAASRSASCSARRARGARGPARASPSASRAARLDARLRRPVIDKPLGLVVLGERLRADARETVEFFQSQGVRARDPLRRPARDRRRGRRRRRHRGPGARRPRPAARSRRAAPPARASMP